MQYEATTPKEYLSQLEDDWRKPKLEQLRAIILNNPGIQEGIKYKMLSYADEKGVFIQLNAQKNYVALYVGNASKVDPSGDLLQGIDHSKGCLRFKKNTAVEDTRIEEFVKLAIKKWKEGEDIGC